MESLVKRLKAHFDRFGDPTTGAPINWNECYWKDFLKQAAALEVLEKKRERQAGRRNDDDKEPPEDKGDEEPEEQEEKT